MMRATLLLYKRHWRSLHKCAGAPMSNVVLLGWIEVGSYAEADGRARRVRFYEGSAAMHPCNCGYDGQSEAVMVRVACTSRV